MESFLNMRRREALKCLIGAAIGCGITVEGHANPSTEENVLSPLPPSQTAAGRVWESPPNCYFAYPHNFGFAPGSGNPIIAQRAGPKVTYQEWDYRTGDLRPIVQTGVGDMYYEVSEGSGRLFFIKDKTKIVSAPINGAGGDQQEYDIHFESTQRMEELLSTKHNGDKLLYAIRTPNADQKTIKSATTFELDVASGEKTAILDMPFDADHQHYCPHDEQWIAFAHDGDITRSLDAVWGLHRAGPQKPGAPMRLWDERAPDGGSLLVGHARWAFHRTGALVVAYPSSQGHPRGLYFVNAAARKAELVSSSDYDWHCNISRSGRWAVVDTKPPQNRKTEDDGRVISDIVLVNMATGRRHWVARSHAHEKHPYHPHPHFTPDGASVIYNDFEHDGRGKASRVVLVELTVR